MKRPLARLHQRLESLAPQRTNDDHSALPMGFLAAWISSRDFRDLVYGIPAMIGAVLLSFGAVIGMSPKPQQSSDTYIKQAKLSRAANQEKLADLYIQRASQVADKTPQAQFEQALALIESGQGRDGMHIMEQLAPVDRNGYRPAHKWLLKTRFEQLKANLRIKQPSLQDQAVRLNLSRRLAAQCQRVLAFDPLHIEANKRLAELNAAADNVDTALRHLKIVVDHEEDLRLMYAGLLARDGQKEQSNQQAELAVIYHQKMLDKHLSDRALNEFHRVKLSAAYMLLKDYPGAGAALMVDGKSPETPMMRSLLTDVLIGWSESEPSIMRQLEYIRKGLELSPNHPNLVRRISQFCDSAGNQAERAERDLRELLDNGHADWLAHVIVGSRDYMSGDVGSGRVHFGRARQINPDSPVTLSKRLAALHIQEKNIDAALRHAEIAVDHEEDFRLTYAQLLDRAGQAEQAKQQAELAVIYHQRMLDKHQSDRPANEFHRMRLSAAYMLLKDHRRAGAALMVDGKAPETPAMRSLLAEVLCRWSESEPDTMRQLEYLRQGLKLSPNHPNLIRRISQFCQSDGEQAERAERYLRELIDNGHADWLAHFVVGTRDYLSGDLEEAQSHFEQALQINPDSPETLNNLGYLLANRTKPDLKRALQLLDQAVAAQPDNAEFRDTRGEIHAKMKRWSNAISDFQFVLKQLPEREGKAHMALAQAWAAKGDPKQAEHHRGLASRASFPPHQPIRYESAKPAFSEPAQP